MFSTFVVTETMESQLAIMPADLQLKYFWALMRFGLHGEEPDFSGMELVAWVPMRDMILHAKRKDEKWREKQRENGKKGGRPKSHPNPENPGEPKKASPSQKSPNDNDNDNDNLNGNGNLNDSCGSSEPPAPGAFFDGDSAQSAFGETIGDFPENLESRKKPPASTAEDSSAVDPPRAGESLREKNGKPKKPPLREREPENGHERVEKAYLENWDRLYRQGAVQTPDPFVNWVKTRSLLKRHFAKLKPEQIIAAIGNGLKNDFVMRGGYSLSTMLSDSVLNGLLNSTGPPRKVPPSLAGKKSLGALTRDDLDESFGEGTE